MGAIIYTLGWNALAEGLAATGTYGSIAAAVEAGAVVVEGAEALGGLGVITGGAGATVVDFATAIEVAKAAELSASATEVGTAATTLLKTETGFKLGGLATMSLPAVAAAAAPLAGVVLGADFYLENPVLWTKISSTLLPFCYAENKIHAFVDFVQNPTTSEYSPVVSIPTEIINALRRLFASDVHFDEIYHKDKDGYHLVGMSGVEIAKKVWSGLFVEPYDTIEGSGPAYGSREGQDGAYFPNAITLKSRWHTNTLSGWLFNLENLGVKNVIPNPYSLQEIMTLANDGTIPTTVDPPTAGVSAPTTPVEPEVWPYPPIIVVPDPLGPDYQPIPVTPITPEEQPETPAIPDPEYVPNPMPEEPPEGWPEEEPWPSPVPVPWTEPGTEPTPDTPYIPWPLPEKRPDEDDPAPDYWPTYPPTWPEEFPKEVPWPDSPDDWPEEVPWPETQPNWWPEGEPWPETPEEWPEDVPWPMPPEWPFPWPDDIPYPWPYPYPTPSEDPYPEPTELPNPNPRVDPIIDPWPWPDGVLDPRTDPELSPTDNPSQPEPTPESPTPEHPPYDPPYNPDPPPSSGEIEPAPIPYIPLPFSATTGLITVYHPTQSELLSFCSWLWVTWQDATIDKIWNNPFDGVIGLFELYCTPTDVGTKTIRSGFLDSGVNSAIISRYTQIDCGSIGVPEYFGNYLDYSPYSKCHIYLPFIGIVELNVDDVVGHGVNVTYRIDEYNGSCIAMVTVAKSTTVNGTEVDYSNIMYQFSGNCAVDLPIAGGSQAAIKAGMLEAAAWGLGSVVGGIMSGGSAGSIGAGMAYGASSAVHSLVSAKSSVQHSGSFGSSFGALGNKKPFIIITRPKQIQVPNYQELYGYPAHKMVNIGACSGYIRCREAHVISPTASDEEKNLIEVLLKEGVYITE